ncbi:hypothetical protein Ciccas_005552 [Cichlidogyrus casuarinus]|uniref:Amidase domain-containing protein n=1 Tax=Cichlidogyrus casuarinus TaxID=1844966 RepID=A0ABD2Q8J5_9PLAT
MNQSWKQQFDRKKAFLKENKTKLHDQLVARQPIEDWKNVCTLTVQQLTQKVVDKQLSPLQILTAFQFRCSLLEERNFLADYLLHADELAVECSEKADKRSPLFGVPVSLKDTFAVSGYDASIGLIKMSICPQKRNSVIYETLLDCGAVPFITTSMAQGGISLNSSSPLFGEQSNAFFEECISGGSSGGEGLAVALDASPIGVGTDIGGSIRFPAAFNGICGLKTTLRRLSRDGMISARTIPELKIKAVPGPIGRSVEDLADFMRAVLCEKHFQLDNSVVPLKFDEQLYLDRKPLKIGYYVTSNSENILQTVPAVRRAVLQSIEILKKLGHEVKEFQVPRQEYALRLYLKSIFHEGGQNIVNYCRDEYIDDSMVDANRGFKLPRLLRKALLPVACKVYGEQIRPSVEATLGLKTAVEAANLVRQIEDYVREFLQEMASLDLLICPVFAGVVPKKSTPAIINNNSVFYTALYNLLDFPAGVVCVTRTNEQDLQDAEKQAADYRKAHDKMNTIIHGDQTILNLPVSVQVAGKPFKEEQVLRVMKELETHSNYKRSVLTF